MPRDPTPSDETGRPAPRRPVRAFLFAVGVALASGAGLAAWAASDGFAPEHGPLVPRGPLLDQLLDQAQASPTQRAQAHQIFDAADVDLRQARAAERGDREQMARLFSQPTVDAVAVEAVRARIERRRDAESRRATQALIDVGMVLNAQQRQAIAGQLTDGPHPFVPFHHPHAASAAL